jgi:hypothetical protein
MEINRKRVVVEILGAIATALIVATAATDARSAQLVGYIENVQDPEDLIQLPGTNWVIAGGRKAAETDQPGHLYLINSHTGQSEVIYPDPKADSPTHELNADCQSPPDPQNFEAHGVGFRSGLNGKSQLYVVNHAFPKGGREAIELFSIDVSGGKPVISWSDCVPTPANAWFNDVVALPEGGFAATNFMDPTDTRTNDKLQSGQDNGNVLEWRKDRGFKTVPNSNMSGANGIEIDPEGKYYFVNAWGSQELIRISRIDHQRVTAALPGLLVDNSAWTWDGRLIVVGQALSAKDIGGCLENAACLIPFKAIEFNPATLESRILIDEKDKKWAATSPRPVNGELWLGAQRTHRVARYKPD